MKRIRRNVVIKLRKEIKALTNQMYFISKQRDDVERSRNVLATDFEIYRRNAEEAFRRNIDVRIAVSDKGKEKLLIAERALSACLATIRQARVITEKTLQQKGIVSDLASRRSTRKRGR
jgi:hypothetical protein